MGVGGARRAPDLTVDELIAPAVVIDIRDKAAHDPNAVVEVADLVAFERRHGRIPEGAAVLMNSGWGERWDERDLAYRGTDNLVDWPFNFPGFSADACEFLIAHRDIVGVGVDTLSTDPGNSVAFPAHEVLGRADRWGLENVANVGELPPRGARSDLSEEDAMRVAIAERRPTAQSARPTPGRCHLRDGPSTSPTSLVSAAMPQAVLGADVHGEMVEPLTADVALDRLQARTRTPEPLDLPGTR